MIRFIPVFITIFVLVACEVEQASVTGKAQEQEQSTVAGLTSLTVTNRVTDKNILQRGQSLFKKNCSRCHGEKAQGTAEWRIPAADGKYPPPPLNGSAHAWHHPTDVLIEVIKDGSMPEGNMPSWEGKLSDSEIGDILSWIQSLWPDEVFKNWQEIDLRSRED